jgi:D-galactose 1-dehydrogenase
MTEQNVPSRTKASKIKIALGGIGKIAIDQHVPALTASPDFELAATISRHGSVPGVEAFSDMETFLAARPDVSAVSLCQPPGPRYAYAEAALKAGRGVMLEKPPGATLAEVFALERLAVERGLTLYASWHSRMARAVMSAKAWLREKRVVSGRIIWREDVRQWHPGQEWVFEPAGMGVFDPGVNALSIFTEILPDPTRLTDAELDVPENRQAPIAARLTFANGVKADFDWRQEGPQTWDIEIETDAGALALREGGAVLEIDGKPAPPLDRGLNEYPALYARMAELLRRREREVDLSPAIFVADAMTLGRRRRVEPFLF